MSGAAATIGLAATGRARRSRGAEASRLRLRDHGVTPVFLLTIVLLTVLAQSSALAFVLLLMHMSDGVMETGNGATLAGFSLLFVAVAVASGLYSGLRNAMLAAVAERFGLRLRAEALQAAVRSAVRTDTAEGHALLQDIGTVQRFLGSPALFGAFELLGAMVPLAILFHYDRSFGLIGLGGITAAILLGLLVHLATRRLAEESRRRLSEASADLSGQLVHPDLVRGLGMLRATAVRWQPRYEAALGSLEGVGGRVIALEGIEHVVLSFYEVAIKAFACYLILSHAGTIGMLMAMNFLAMQVVMPYSNLARAWEGWAFALQSWRRLREALQQDGAPVVHAPDAAAPQGLVIEGLGFAPPGRAAPIIDGLTLRVAPGTALTVEGRNGVGKSTLLRLVLGLMAPTAGRVMLDGQDSRHCERGAFGARIGYLPQDVQLLEGSVLHNIGRGPGAPPPLVVEAARAAGAHEMIARLPAGYETPSGATSGLSAGQRRLIGLARALYGAPRLLVLDEPEVGLDGQARLAMRQAVAAVRARGGVVLVVTHEPETWRDSVDLRLLLGEGGAWQVRPAHDADGDDSPRCDLATLP